MTTFILGLYVGDIEFVHRYALTTNISYACPYTTPFHKTSTKDLRRICLNCNNFTSWCGMRFQFEKFCIWFERNYDLQKVN